MAMTINTNVISMNAQRNLGISGGSLGTTMQRLSSGLRVNSAKDDAAGLAIAERMNAQAKGLAVAARNANDGISLAQTTEGALGKVGDMLQRMRELAVQASNATNSASDRKALQAELSQLTSEIDRVAKTTSFNGTKVLDGSFAGGVFQVGAQAGDNITVGATTKATAAGLGAAEYGASKAVANTGAVTSFAEVVTGLKINDVELGDLAKANSEEERLGQVVAAINAKSADTGVTAFMTNKGDGVYTLDIRSESDKAVTFEGFSAATTGFTATASAAPAAMTVPASFTSADTGSVAAFEQEVTTLKESTGWQNVGNSKVVQDAWDSYKANSSDGTATAFSTAVASAGAVASAWEAITSTSTAGSAEGLALAGSLAALDSSLGSATASATMDELVAMAQKALGVDRVANGLNITANEVKETSGIDKLDISSQAGAWEAIKQIDSALDQVNAARADLGALQTRFEKTVENIDIQTENITAARGRIVDADFATETANLSRSQILQQAGTAMVAQANQLPQNVLSLLR